MDGTAAGLRRGSWKWQFLYAANGGRWQNRVCGQPIAESLASGMEAREFAFRSLRKGEKEPPHPWRCHNSCNAIDAGHAYSGNLAVHRRMNLETANFVAGQSRDARTNSPSKESLPAKDILS